MAKRMLSLAGAEPLERFSSATAADYRFGSLNILGCCSCCLAGLALHLALHPFQLGDRHRHAGGRAEPGLPDEGDAGVGVGARCSRRSRRSYLFLRHRPESEVLVATVVVAGILSPALQMAYQWERAVILRFGRFRGLARLGPVPDRAGGRQGLELRRPAHPGHRLQRRDDADPRHGARQRRRDRLLDGVGRGEVGARGRGLRRRGDAVGPDGPARRDRQARAGRHAVAPRPPGQGDPAGARRQDQRLGHHRPVGRDPRHHHPEGARGRDEPPGAGRARAPVAHHPLDGGDRDRRQVRGGLAATTRTTRPRCTCAR